MDPLVAADSVLDILQARVCVLRDLQRGFYAAFDSGRTARRYHALPPATPSSLDLSVRMTPDTQTALPSGSPTCFFFAMGGAG